MVPKQTKVFARSEEPASTPGRHIPVMLGIALAVAGVMLSLALGWYYSQRNDRLLEQTLVSLAERESNEIVQQFQLVQYGLRGARGAVMTAGPTGISRKIFNRYSQSRDLQNEFPGVLGFGFIRRVEATQATKFVDQAKMDGAPNFRIKSLSDYDGEHYVIQYIEPEEPNRAAVGLDIASNPERREAAYKSLSTGEATLTAPISLVQADGQNRLGFLLLLPIYAEGAAPANRIAREQQGFGWSYAPLLISRSLERWSAPLGVHVRILDVTDSARPVAFFDYAKRSLGSVLASSVVNKDMFGRKWQFRYEADDQFLATLRPAPVGVIVSSSMALSFVLAVLLSAMASNALRKGQARMTAARLAAIVQSSNDAIIGKTTQGVITSWNDAAQSLFGFSPDEALGKTVRALLVPDALAHEEDNILARISRGEHVPAFETQRRRKDGSLVSVSVSVSLVRDSSGRVIGASKLVRDITAQKRLESELYELNANLEALVEERTVALEAAQRGLRTVLDAVPSMISYWDNQLILRVANNAYHEWFGVAPGSLLGRDYLSVAGSELFATNQDRIEAALKGEPQTFELSACNAQGEHHHLLTHYKPDWVDGEIRGFYSVTHDVTGLVRGREALQTVMRRNEALLQLINEQLLYVEMDADLVLTEVNDLFCATLAHERVALLGQSLLTLSEPIEGQGTAAQIQAVVQHGQAWHGELRSLASDGSVRWSDTVVVPLLNEQGMIERCISIGVDTTQRKLADLQYQRLSLLLSNVLEAASEVSIIATDADGLITVFNLGAERMLGYAASEMIGLQTPAIIHLPEQVAVRGGELSAEYGVPIDGFQVFVHVAERFGSERRDWTYVRKDGTRLEVSLVVTAMRDKTGKVLGYLGIATDISADRAKERQLLAMRDQLQMATDIAELGVWSWTLADSSLSWNDKMFNMYAQPKSLRTEGLSLQHWRDRLFEEDVQPTIKSITDAAEGLATFNTVFRIVWPNGEIRHIQAIAYLERDAQGKPTKLTGINRDLTELRQYEARLLEAKLQAEQASVAKSQFLANMSHEIRTPMNAVLGLLQLLQQTNLDARQQDYLEKTHIAARSLLGLLNDILDFSKIEAGKLELEPHEFELETFFRDLAVVLTGYHGSKDVELLFDVDPSLPKVVCGDSLRLQQVLINLAGNALKFTERGQVVLRARMCHVMASKVTIRFEVSDTGIGISAEQLARLFQGFAQAEASTTRRFGGTGLGLVISQRLVSLMGGRIEVESELGKGACFHFQVELETAEASSVIKIAADSGRLEKLDVLVVDDNEVSAQTLADTLRALGCKPTIASGGERALELVEAMTHQGQTFDAVLMDWRMPGLDGLQTARKLRAFTQEGKPPVVIMVTAFGRDVLADLIEQDDPPFVDFLTKPVTPGQLARSLTTAVSGESSLRRKPQRLADKGLKGLRILLVEDNALNRQVASELLISEGASVLLAEGGQRGVAIALAEAARLDIVIMDMQMPDMDGLEATRHIREHLSAKQLPIVAMTANASQADKEACLAAGMNDHIAKPIQIDEVVAKLLHVLGGKQGQETSALGADPRQHAAEIVKYETLMRRFGNNSDTYMTALKGFLPEALRLVEQLREEIISNETAVAATLHALKGVSATVGALSLAHLAAEWEEKAKHGEWPSKMPAQWQALSANLRQRAEHAYAALRRQMPAVEPEIFPSAAEPELDPAIWWPRLQQLGLLLERGNLAAIDEMERLVVMAPARIKEEASDLLALIQSLDFDAAHTVLKKLLEDNSESAE